MSSDSGRKKVTFVIVFLSLILLAAFTAFKFNAFGLEEARKHGSDAASAAEAGFFSYFMVGFIILFRNTSNSGRLLQMPPWVLIMYTYAVSVFFTLVMLFMGPANALINILVYFLPVLMWHQKKIKTWVFVIISIILIVLSAVCFQKYVTFLLLLPTLHLIAIRTNNSLKSRYTSDTQRIYTQLSSTQKKEIGGSLLSRKNFDWWAIIEPELDDLMESWSKIHGSPKENSDENSINLTNSLLSIQTHNEMTKAMDVITKRDPNFSTNFFLQRFRKTFNLITTACSNQDIEKIQPMVSDALYEQFRCRIEEQKKAGIKFNLSSINISGSDVQRVATNDEFDELHLFVMAEIKETAIDILTKKNLSTDVDAVHHVNEYWTFIRRANVQTKTNGGLLESQCPNCGNVLKIGQATVCSACNSYVRSGSFDWVLAQITQASEWCFSSPATISGWQQLQAQDRNLSIQQIKDKAAVIFWTLKRAEQIRNSEAMLRYATSECNELLNKFLFASKTRYSYNEAISIGAVDLKGIAIRDKYVSLYLLITWSGVSVSFNEQGRVPTAHRFIKPYRDIFVLTRQSNITTKIENTLTSAHCYNCGGPLSSGFDIKCNYCSSILNDGSEWILDKIIKENTNEYQMILNNRPLPPQIAKTASNKSTASSNNIHSGRIRSGREMITIAASVMLADGVIDKAELYLLKELGRRFKMSEESVMNILEVIKSGEFPPVNFMCSSYEDIFDLIDVAIEMALADGNISKEEKDAILLFAKQMNFVESDINIRIRKIMNQKGIKPKKP